MSYTTRLLGILTKSDVQYPELRVPFVNYAARGMSLLETSSFVFAFLFLMGERLETIQRLTRSARIDRPIGIRILQHTKALLQP